MNFINPLGFIAFLSVPIILLMYILKQKFKKHEVSAMLLWNRAVQKSEGHKWRQKLKRNTLMLLQIITAAFTALAITNPFVSSNGEKLDYTFVLDTSFSMAASDESPTRLEKAKEDVLRLIEQAPDGCLFSVVNLNAEPEIVVERTDAKRAASNAVLSVKQTYSGRDEEALVYIINLLQSEEKSNVYVFTDSDVETEFENMAVRIYGKSGENYAVKLVSENGGNILVKVESHGMSNSTVPVAIFGDGVIIDTKDVELRGNGSSADVIFSADVSKYNSITAKILVDDILSEDNSFTYIPPKSNIKRALLVTKGNIFLEKAIMLTEGIELYKKKESSGELSGYDIYIFDGDVPEEMPKDGHIMVINPGESFAYKKGEYDFDDVTISSGIFGENAENLSFSVKAASSLMVPNWAETVLKCKDETLAYAGDENGIKTFVIGFDIHNSDFPLKKEFPILIYNVMNYFSVGGLKTEGELFAGQKAELQLSPKSEKTEIISPSGNVYDIAYYEKIFSDTDEIGVYTISEKSSDGEDKAYFAVNPVTEGESDMEIGKDVSYENEVKTKVKTGKSLKNVFVIAALIILALEWRVKWRGN